MLDTVPMTSSVCGSDEQTNACSFQDRRLYTVRLYNQFSNYGIARCDVRYDRDPFGPWCNGASCDNMVMCQSLPKKTKRKSDAKSKVVYIPDRNRRYRFRNYHDLSEYMRQYRRHHAIKPRGVKEDVCVYIGKSWADEVEDDDDDGDKEGTGVEEKEKQITRVSYEEIMEKNIDWLQLYILPKFRQRKKDSEPRYQKLPEISCNTFTNNIINNIDKVKETMPVIESFKKHIRDTRQSDTSNTKHEKKKSQHKDMNKSKADKSSQINHNQSKTKCTSNLNKSTEDLRRSISNKVPMRAISKVETCDLEDTSVNQRESGKELQGVMHRAENVTFNKSKRLHIDGRGRKHDHRPFRITPFTSSLINSRSMDCIKEGLPIPPRHSTLGRRYFRLL